MPRPRQPIRHGTVSGYQAERLRKIPTCVACRAAWRTHYALIRAEKARHAK